MHSEVLVDGSHRTRTLTNGSRNSLHGSRPDVTYSKDSGYRGFEWQRFPFGEDWMFERTSGDRAVGEDETLLIKHDPTA
jgi:hypothetical protein